MTVTATFTATATDHASASAAMQLRRSLVAGPELDADALISAALFTGAQKIVWVYGPGDYVPKHLHVHAIESTTALLSGSLEDADDDTVVVFDRCSLNPFGNPGDRFALLGGAPNARSVVRRTAP